MSLSPSSINSKKVVKGHAELWDKLRELKTKDQISVFFKGRNLILDGPYSGQEPQKATPEIGWYADHLGITENSDALGVDC